MRNWSNVRKHLTYTLTAGAVFSPGNIKPLHFFRKKNQEPTALIVHAFLIWQHNVEKRMILIFVKYRLLCSLFTFKCVKLLDASLGVVAI
jgi:hypothetical protein